MAIAKLTDDEEKAIEKRFNKKEIDKFLAGVGGSVDVAIGRFLLANGWHATGDGKKVENPNFMEWHGTLLTSADALTIERMKLLYEKAK